MKYSVLFHNRLLPASIVFAIIISGTAQAQTDIDGLMMEKNAFCVGPAYRYSSWKNYWEGTLKRENLNLGRVYAKTYSIMGIYGLTRKVNLLFSAPYVKTKASAGTLHGMKGIQDLSLFIKWRPIQKRIGDGRLSIFGIAGASAPVSNYVPDYLPVSIGLHCKTLSARLTADYQEGNLFATVSGTYVYRYNIKIDRSAYYTTEQHLTNEVAIPDATNFNFRGGYRTLWFIAEAVVNKWTTLGGFDISRNNMPFPSNKMNATTVGANFKYVLPSLSRLSIVAGGDATVSGRNVGKASTVYGSLFYVFDLSHNAKTSVQPVKTN